MKFKYETEYKLATTQHQEQRLINEELIAKFDGDKQLVEQFLEAGYTTEELQKSSIIHPTKMDPICVLEDGITHAGIWLYRDNNHNTNKGVRYSNSRF